MSVQFGRWNFDGQPPPRDYVEKVTATLVPYGPDSDHAYCKDGVKILYRAFHTTRESHHEIQPSVSPSGAVITLDGRLDNRDELISNLRNTLTIRSTDIAIVTAAFERWGANCFGKLVGDWAISIWNPNDHSLILAKDPIGTRHLYYSFDCKQVTWSSLLEPLVRFAGKNLTICEEYIAGWFSYFPAVHLTPYLEIHAVPPSCSVLLRPGKQLFNMYWDFDPTKTIRYRTDSEYEEHFRAVFSKAVQRRLRSDRPVLAELSGGLDSSSIVCMADSVLACGTAETPRLDTISWYDDSYDHVEPDTNEIHWIVKVEEKRGRTGRHIDLHSLRKHANPRTFPNEFANDSFATIPTPNELSEQFREYAAYMVSQGHRVTLSGIGGNEITGGDTPTPVAELQDLLARAHFFIVARQLSAWSVKMRRTRLSLILKAAQGFFCPSLTGIPIDIRIAPWFRRGFIRRNFAAVCGYPSRVKLFGSLPSFQENIIKLNVLRRVLANWFLQPGMLREVRFPYLDRDLLEFLYAIPREQNVGIGKRRFLMRRALVNIVPDELLNRRRKAFVPPGLSIEKTTEWLRMVDMGVCMDASLRDFIDPNRFSAALRQEGSNENGWLDLVSRTLTLLSWLCHLRMQGILTHSRSSKGYQYSSALEVREDQVRNPSRSSAT
jgi:asparagine synthase (glutamine-hydrolysing)